MARLLRAGLAILAVGVLATDPGCVGRGKVAEVPNIVLGEC